MSDRRLFITGATGLVGRALTAAALDGGWQVCALCRDPGRVPPGWAGRVQIVTGDLRALEGIRRALPGCRAVINAAGVLSDPQGRPVFEEGNVHGPLRLLEEAAIAGVPYVQVSSAGVYGQPRGALLGEGEALEQHPERRGLYTETKLAGEKQLRRRARELGLPLAVVRPGVVFGAGAAVPEGRLTAGLPGGAVLLFGTPSTPFSVTHADNLAEALLLLADAPRRGVWNVVDDQALTQRAWRQARRAARPGRRLAVYLPLALALALAKPLAMLGKGRDLPYKLRRNVGPFALDGSRLRRETGWRPRWDLAEALRRSGPQPI